MSRTIFISAGHGAGDPGAAGPGGPAYPFTEADLTLELRDLVADMLEPSGFTILRDGNKGESLSKYVSVSRARAADLALDIHFNAAPKKGGTGVECFGLEPTQPLCALLAGRVGSVLKLKLRGRAGYKHPSESQHPSLGFCSAGGILLEVCFLTKGDLDVYLPRKKDVAKAIATVLIEHARGMSGTAARSGNDTRRGLVGRRRATNAPA